MAAFDFPAAPAPGDEYTANDITFTWTGDAWLINKMPALPLLAPIMQQLRTADNNKPPADNSLLPGQLAVEMGDPCRLWVGVPTGTEPTGKKLLAHMGSGDPFVNITGDTMTGDLTIAKEDPSLILNRATVAGGSAEVEGMLAGVRRWVERLGDTTAEAGANAGSDYVLQAYSDAGAAGPVALRGKRATGLLTVVGPPTDPLGIANKAYVDAAVTGAPISAMAQHNVMINGSCEISQDIALAAGVTAHATAFTDGWTNYKIGTVVNNARQINTNPGTFPGLASQLELQTTTAQAAFAGSDGCGIFESIEGFRLQRVAAGSVDMPSLTLGFWSSHVRTGIYSGAFRITGTGAVTKSYVFEYTQVASAVPQWNCLVIPPLTTGGLNNNMNDVSGYLNFSQAAGPTIQQAAGAWGANGNAIASPNQINGAAALTDRFRISGVVLIPGSILIPQAQAPFALRPYFHELAECQRYFEYGHFSVGGIQSSSMTSRGYQWPVGFRVTKRTVPTMSLSNLAFNRCSSPTTVAVHPNGFAAFTTNTAAGGDDISASANFNASARL